MHSWFHFQDQECKHKCEDDCTLMTVTVINTDDGYNITRQSGLYFWPTVFICFWLFYCFVSYNLRCFGLVPCSNWCGWERDSQVPSDYTCCNNQQKCFRLTRAQELCDLFLIYLYFMQAYVCVCKKKNQIPSFPDYESFGIHTHTHTHTHTHQLKMCWKKLWWLSAAYDHFVFYLIICHVWPLPLHEWLRESSWRNVLPAFSWGVGSSTNVMNPGYMVAAGGGEFGQKNFRRFCTVFEGAVSQVPSEFSRPNLGYRVIWGVDFIKVIEPHQFQARSWKQVNTFENFEAHKN